MDKADIVQAIRDGNGNLAAILESLERLEQRVVELNAQVANLQSLIASK